MPTTDEDWAQVEVLYDGKNPFREMPSYTLGLCRQFRELSQAEVAKASGLYQSDVSKMENAQTLDRLQLSTIRKYAKALGAEVQLVVVVDGRRYVLAQ